MGSVAARFRGPNDPAMPAFVGMADLTVFFADLLGPASRAAYEAADAAGRGLQLNVLLARCGK
jgi:hypothetical protein